MANILVYALQYEGAFNKNSLGAVSEAAKLASEIGGEAHAIVVGEGISDDLCSSLGNYGATKVLRVGGPEGLAQPVVDAMAAAVGAGDYGYALFGGGLLGFEIGAGLAARLNAGVAMEVTAVRAEGGKLVAERPILGDSAISEISFRSDLGIIIGRLNAFEITESGGSATVEDLSVDFGPVTTPHDRVALSGGPLYSGVVALVALGEGRLLVLERSAAVGVPPVENRIYLVDTSTAAEARDVEGKLVAIPAVAKTLLWKGALGVNLEGLCAGPRLPDGRTTLVAVADNGADDGAEVVIEQHDSCRLACDIRAPATHGDADICRLQGRRIVHPSPRHRHDFPGLP